MSWKKGFFRLWIVLSCFWIAFNIYIGNNAVFYKIPNKSDVLENYATIIESYNCKIKNISNSTLNKIVENVSADIVNDISTIQNNINSHRYSDADIKRNAQEIRLLNTRLNLIRSSPCEEALIFIRSSKYLSENDRKYISILKSGQVDLDSFKLLFKEISPYASNDKACYGDYKFVLTREWSEELLCEPGDIDAALQEISKNRLEAIKDISYMSLIPPIVLFMLGYIILWIIKGFKAK